jgi:hypothetical protein
LPFPGRGSSRVGIAPLPGQPPLSEVKFLPVDLDLIRGAGRAPKSKFAEIFQ